MPDFSASGIEALPATTSETLEKGDPRVRAWLREVEDEGDHLNQQDPSEPLFETAMRYVAGDHRQNPAKTKPSWLPNLVINQSRKVVQAHVSALTDLKPLFAYVTHNPQFGPHAHLLNKWVVQWWTQTMADIALGDVVKYAVIAGTGDMATEWDPTAGIAGDNRFLARDPRDTLPFRPVNQKDLQIWQGLTLRDEIPINALRIRFPAFEHLYTKPSSDTTLGRLKGRLRSIGANLQRPVGDTLSGLDAPVKAQPRFGAGGIVIRRTYLADMTRNLTTDSIAMGEAGTNWAYVVPPQGLLYPRKRLIVWTDEGILSDGPNPYWHGKYPVSRLELWGLPWHFRGISLLQDTLPIQDGINDTANDVRNGLKMWMEPPVAFDRMAVSESFMKTYDPRKPKARIKLNAGFGDGFKHIDGPHPRVLQVAMDFTERLIGLFNDLSSTTNLEAMLKLRQMPGADTIQKFHDLLTPQIRQEARQLEGFLRVPAEMIKSNIWQFESKAKREMVLGSSAALLSEFDIDPEHFTLIPALSPGAEGYTKELDARIPPDQRARFVTQQLVFTVAPNSLIALHAQEQQLKFLQLSRMGFVDVWTLAEIMEIPNYGPPPPVPLPPITQPTQEELQEGMSVPGAQQGGPGGGNGRFIIDPESGQVLEIRVPITIPERLMAMQQLGIGQAVNPAGRKAAGDASPRLTSKDGGTRPTVTESRR